MIHCGTVVIAVVVHLFKPGLSLRQQAEIVHRDRRAGDRRDVGMVVGRRNLDDIGADEIEPVEPAQDRQRLRRGRPARRPACRCRAR